MEPSRVVFIEVYPRVYTVPVLDMSETHLGDMFSKVYQKIKANYPVVMHNLDGSIWRGICTGNKVSWRDIR